MESLKGKKLLVLGGGLSSKDVVLTAKKHGIYTVVADYYEKGVAKEIADESVQISTADIEALLKIVEEKKIDGVFCGPSEFNIVNALKLCELANVPFYVNKAQWDKCSDKAEFKQLCREYNVPCVPEYYLTDDFDEEDLKRIKYPVMVKPVDSSSSRGISVCNNSIELRSAYKEALKYSERKKVIVEKYISNDIAFVARYLAYNGEIYFLLANDQYIVDPIERKALISGTAIYPSKRTKEYIETIDNNIKNMIKSIELKNGTFFLQALVDPDDGNIYFHEMGLRLSGGKTYTITDPVMGINDMEMMVKLSVGGDFSNDEEIAKVDPYMYGKTAVSFCVPLKPGKIAKIEGVDEILAKLQLLDYVQYYSQGDEITEKKVGTLDQHFCRFKFLVDEPEKVGETIENIQAKLEILDVNNNNMIFRKFDINRLRLD